MPRSNWQKNGGPTAYCVVWSAPVYSPAIGGDQLEIFARLISPNMSLLSDPIQVSSPNIVDDTLPDLQLDVTGLSSNPTGSTVKFSMWCGGSTTATVDAATAAISNIELVGTTYSATLIYDWIAADTATAGSCLGRFHLTLAGGDTMTLPPRKQVPVTISR